jgi:dTDP-4-amino-4,6-dideoxygalactose transaminase
MIPVSRPWFGAEEESAVVATLRSRWVAEGPRVAEFERAFAAYLGQAQAIAVSSGTTGLHLALQALGLGPGDEVIVPSLSFIATANSVVHAGATPVFADVDLATYNLSVASAEAALSSRTRAILLVHQAGLPADLDAFRALAARAGVTLVEDAACAIGSRLRGRLIGGDSAIAVFSFHPRKLLTTGEGGMIVTSDATLAARLRSLRNHGVSMSAYDRHAAGAAVIESYGTIGYNFRMTDLQGAVGLVQLGRIEDFVTRRIELGERYTRALTGHPGIAVPSVAPDVRFNYQTYQVRLTEKSRIARDALMRAFLEEGISTRRGIMASHREPSYRERPLRVPLPATETADRDAIVLPLYHDLEPHDQDRVIKTALELV